jgi:hypothetical protein
MSNSVAPQHREPMGKRDSNNNKKKKSNKTNKQKNYRICVNVPSRL